MRILVSGASGLIGRALMASFRGDGLSPIRLVRSQADGRSAILWDPGSRRFDTSAANGADVVVHLAGENIASGRWTAKRRRAIRESREVGTRLICEGLATMDPRPSVLVSASATGFYGSRGDEELDEQSSSGSGFLAEVCRTWEAATEPAARAGIRVVNLRFGVVLDKGGGALAKMLPIFRLGLGGRVGDGAQWMSWVTLEDCVRAIRHAVDQPISGAVNAVAPVPVRNRDFATALGRHLGRPTLFPAPAVALRLALGQMADETLLASSRVIPQRLTDAGFAFRSPTIDEGLRAALG